MDLYGSGSDGWGRYHTECDGDYTVLRTVSDYGQAALCMEENDQYLCGIYWIVHCGFDHLGAETSAELWQTDYRIFFYPCIYFLHLYE